MATRRELRAGLAAAGPAIPAALLRFDAADWPPTKDAPDLLGGAERFFGRRRWHAARRRFAEANGMTVNDIWRMAWAG